MSTPKPQVIRAESVEVRAEVPVPTKRLSLLRPGGESVASSGPDGLSLEVIAGSERDRRLVWLDEGLSECAEDSASDPGALGQVLERVLRGQAPAPEMLAAARDYVESLRRRPPRGRRKAGAERPVSREESFLRLAVALGLISAQCSPDYLQREL